MAKLDVLKTIEKTRERIADRYDVYPEDLMKIMKKYVHPYSITSAAFTLGYAQGVKATKLEKDPMIFCIVIEKSCGLSELLLCTADQRKKIVRKNRFRGCNYGSR